ncbi:LytR/AlgR family response regulator transcription factor [Ancylomarina longa]|uniref:DNA-binding response regulator n=1 Tax=Ancylomarina longa TaxID=2487017 RepID=A0A434AW14_9BACT|nr:LytTR family DNA-binding domain-containing protein [Ancylomarina longa]RUT78660.1 DNA-binding response regulator [Ancylomarina longa]
MIFKAIILDRDLSHIEKIQKYGELLPFLEFKACFSKSETAMAFLNKNPVDIIFADLEFIQNDTFSWQATKLCNPKIIISLDNPAYEFKNHCLSAFEYIKKPLTFETFVKPLNRIYIQKQLNPATQTSVKEARKNDFFFVKNNAIIERIKFKDILFFKGLKDYIWIQTIHKKVITLQTMKNLTEHLPSEQFIRIHKSFIVSLEHIDCIDRNKVVIGSERLPIGDTFRPGFFKQLKERELIWD